jgi:hypothetical protein
MSNPLPDPTVSALQTHETAALAAAMIIASSFPEILDFAARISARRPAPESPKRARGVQSAVMGTRERCPTNATSGWRRR